MFARTLAGYHREVTTTPAAASGHAIRTLQQRKLQLIRQHRAEQQRLVRELQAGLAQIDQLMAEAADGSLALPCLVSPVTSPGTAVYHSKDQPCGWVWIHSLDAFEECPEHDALQRHPTRCTACDWKTAATTYAHNNAQGS
ncbi:hypothetical protein [Streptomyces sp. NPDC127098]|uniref:hypothetical protein n=1 Tax=Streptomyces sp. NPDC127098 TaxID=3347137 RepID=UPI00365D0020